MLEGPFSNGIVPSPIPMLLQTAGGLQGQAPSSVVEVAADDNDLATRFQKDEALGGSRYMDCYWWKAVLRACTRVVVILPYSSSSVVEDEGAWPDGCLLSALDQ